MKQSEFMETFFTFLEKENTRAWLARQPDDVWDADAREVFAALDAFADEQQPDATATEGPEEWDWDWLRAAVHEAIDWLDWKETQESVRP